MDPNQAIVALKKESGQLQAIMSLFHSQNAAVLVAQEIAYLESLALRTPAIAECEPITALLAVKGVLKMNLTMDPQAGLVYVKTRNFKQGTVWKKGLEIEPTANGRLSFARMCGRVLDHKRPEVFFAEDGKVNKVQVELLLPSHGGPRWETFEFTDEVDFFRWKRASHKENRRTWDNADDARKETLRGKIGEPNEDKMNYANENYTNFRGGIDPEFARAKALKHALKKLGTNQAEGNKSMPTLRFTPIDIEKDATSTRDELEITPHEEVSSSASNQSQSYNPKNL